MKIDNIILMIPLDKWETLQETLEMDAKSSSFDRQLRQEIRTALDSITPITGATAALLDEAEMIPRAAKLTVARMTTRAVGEDRVKALAKAVKFFRSQFEMLGGRRIYGKKLV